MSNYFLLHNHNGILIKPNDTIKDIHNALLLVSDFTQSTMQINHGTIKRITHLKILPNIEAWVINPYANAARLSR